MLHNIEGFTKVNIDNNIVWQPSCMLLVQSGNESDIRAADLNTFCRLCEENLDMKPGVSRLGCKRLGKPADYTDKPRKLLVYLNSDSAASSLLKSAKQLRKSDDPYIATHVFINPDLSPADSKIAYEEHERLRHIRAQKSGSNHNTQPPVAESGGSSAPLGNSNTAISLNPASTHLLTSL